MKHVISGLLVVVALILSSPAEAQRADRKDFQIAMDILSIVNGYDRYSIFDDISVNVKDGVVTMTGKVTYGIKAQEIAKLAKQVKGVVEVKNEVQQLPASKFDDNLRSSIADAIYSNPSFSEYQMLKNKPIHIIVENGTVTLTGIVNGDLDRRLAYSLAMGSNAPHVINQLKTANEAQADLNR